MSLCSNNFIDILEPRQREFSNILFMYRGLSPIQSYKQKGVKTPEVHKENVFNKFQIKDFIETVCQENNLNEDKLKRKIWDILDEIGFEKELTVVRWLGWTLLKLYLKAFQGILINEAAVFNLKSIMGNCPVILVPSHRSYVDFTVMSYLCFHYDIKMPAIAAGIDFKGMAIFGKLLRQVGAFYMRRSFSSSHSLYWQIFQEYVHDIVTNGDQPIEFFIEGTRSRSGKSLYPKLGLLSMLLQPYFVSQVPDILFVPVNLSYDRVLEEQLFAYELLGVPKPKESTKGFFQSLRYLHQDYGRVYVTFSNPISAANFFGKVDRSVHSLGPQNAQQLTRNEKNSVFRFAIKIVKDQQQNTIITASNLFATVLLNSYVDQKAPLTLRETKENVSLIKSVLVAFGANVAYDCDNFEESLKNTMEIHKNLFCFEDGKLQLIKNHEKLVYNCMDKLKGHVFLEKTMNLAVPFILLQEYVNPTLYFLVNPSIIVCILISSCSNNLDDLFRDFTFLRSLFSYEFVGVKGERSDFENSWKILQQLKIISCNNKGQKTKLFNVLCNLLQPFFLTYHAVMTIIHNGKELSENEITKKSQAYLEDALIGTETFINPYILSLNTISNCIFSLNSLGVINKVKMGDTALFCANPEKLACMIYKIENFVNVFPKIWPFKGVHIRSKF